MNLTPHQARRALSALLYSAGGLISIAVIPAVMPWSWMAWWHDWLGLGTMPADPLLEYLARATSGLCFVYGIFLIYCGTNPQRNLVIMRGGVTLVAVIATAIGPLMWRTDFPKWWLAADGVTNLLLAGSVWWLSAAMVRGAMVRGAMVRGVGRRPRTEPTKAAERT